MLSGYPFLAFPPIMSQVHLSVPALAPLEEEKLNGEVAQVNTVLTTSHDVHQKYLKDIFDALSQKNVEKILKVTVEDSTVCPCTDEVIEECLQKFDVRYLDWRKPDLCSDVLVRAAPNIVELTLYSSGNNAVLRGWASAGGLCSLNLVCIEHAIPTLADSSLEAQLIDIRTDDKAHHKSRPSK